MEALTEVREPVSTQMVQLFHVCQHTWQDHFTRKLLHRCDWPYLNPTHDR